MTRGRKDPEETENVFLRRSFPVRIRAGEEDRKGADARGPEVSESREKGGDSRARAGLPGCMVGRANGLGKGKRARGNWAGWG